LVFVYPAVIHSHRITFVLSFMPSINFEHHTQFFTSTIFEWKHLLKDDVHKQIIIDSLLFLKKEGSIIVNAFVIMPNHIHTMLQLLVTRPTTAVEL
jgi:REP element-mobilizing transposase RayT